MQKVIIYQNNINKEALAIVIYQGVNTIIYDYLPYNPSAIDLIKSIKLSFDNTNLLCESDRDNFLDRHTYILDLNFKFDKDRA